MPHKHRRKLGDDADFNLPPNQKALPLSAIPRKHKQVSTSRNGQSSRRTSNTRRSTTEGDDAPRSFKRLMAFARGQKQRSGLDERDNKRLIASDASSRAETPRIRVGEDLRSFAARVDASLPLSGLAKKAVVRGGKDVLGLKVHRTRKEKKMHQLYDQWREEERKIQERREEQIEESAEKELEYEAAGIAPDLLSAVDGRTNKKGKRRRGHQDDSEDDPWLELKRRRGETQPGLHNVALAPPELHIKPSKLLNIRGAVVNVGSAPKSAGSLRRREELEGERKDVVEAYRRIREHEQAKLHGDNPSQRKH